jgi:hypothetical protein
MLTVPCSFRAASCFWRYSSPAFTHVFSHTPAGSSVPSQQVGSKDASTDGEYYETEELTTQPVIYTRTWYACTDMTLIRAVEGIIGTRTRS